MIPWSLQGVFSILETETSRVFAPLPAYAAATIPEIPNSRERGHELFLAG
jgi:hypothetical protein